MYEKIKKWFKQGLWTEQMVMEAVKRNIITQAEYEELVSMSGE